MTRYIAESTVILPRILIVGIDAPYHFTKVSSSYFEEFRNLVRSNGMVPTKEIYIKLRTVDPAYFVTKGKLEEIQKICDEEKIEEVIFSEQLSAQQERNLSDLLQARVFDRTQLILEIFERGAQSAEGKIQVALALLQHKKSRLAGRGISMSQQAGSIGTRGPGETQKEKETQHIEHLMVKLRRDLEKVRQIRETQRKKRLSSNTPHVCLIGYTNAGKSTILNAITHSDVLAEDRLFATLDTTTRELYVDSKKIGVISDTVGFIQQLPHNLIEAFKSTLDELQYAHLLLHVIDSADPNFETHINVVHQVLEELGVKKPMLYVFNKIDKVKDMQALEIAARRYNPHVFISAASKEGIQPLIDYLIEWNPKKQRN
jgi:GTPase